MGGVAIFVPAAGASRRMGGLDKLTRHVGQTPLLLHVIRQAEATKVPVWVGLPPENSLRHALLDQTTAHKILVEDWQNGMAASFRAAGILAEQQNYSALLIVLADMPEILTADLMQFIAQHHRTPNNILRGVTEDGQAGHPVLIPSTYFFDMQKLTGDKGAQKILTQNAANIRKVTLRGEKAVLDLDTLEDWERWRAQSGP